jgi:hypothetical protein
MENICEHPLNMYCINFGKFKCNVDSLMLINHKRCYFIVIYYVPVYEQGTFLPLIVPPTLYQAGLWSTWLAVLCSLKVFILY